MPKAFTIKDVCEITSAHAIRTGDFSRFDAWVTTLTRTVDDAQYQFRVARDSVSSAHHAARYRRAVHKAVSDLKAIEAAQAAAWTARNKVLLASAEAAAKTA